MNSSVHIEAVTQGGITQAPQQHGGGVARGLGWLMPSGVLGGVGRAGKKPEPRGRRWSGPSGQHINLPATRRTAPATLLRVPDGASSGHRPISGDPLRLRQL